MTFTMIIAFCALAVSITHVYFQFLRKKRKIYFLFLGLSKYRRWRFGIANGGNHNVFLCGISVDLKEPTQGRGYKSVAAGPLHVKNDSLILSANEIQEFGLDIPDEIPKGLSPKVKKADGGEYDAVDLLLSVCFAFPDGKKYRAEVKIGELSVRQDGTERGCSISKGFIDLTKISRRCD